jgi:threonine synthase
MEKFLHYQCSKCREIYAQGDVTYLCPADDGVLDVIMDWETIGKNLSPSQIFESNEESLWRYLPLLPLGDPGWEGTPLRAAGWTPVYKIDGLAEELGLRNFWVKDESSNPTASFKDRASALLVARAEQIGAEVIVTASTGNAGAALAGMAAAVGARAVIFAPKSAPAAKVAQLLIFGAEVFLVDGNYDDAVALSQDAADEFGWYCRNTGYNPYTAEGKKTASFEIWEQLLTKTDLVKPLCLFVSVGDGNIISGLHKGFRDLEALGWIEGSPRIFGVQAKGSAAIANAFEARYEEITAVSADTLADSISVDMPSDGLRALRAATQTDGAYVKVSDDEILEAIPQLGKVGIFAEPAGAAAFAGVRKAVESELIAMDDPVLVVNTGSGLKDVAAAQKAAGSAKIIEPTMAALKNAMGAPI